MKRYIACIAGLLFLALFETAYADNTDLSKEQAYQASQFIQLAEERPFFILNIGAAEAETMQPNLGDLRLYSNGVELGFAQIPPQSERYRMKEQEQRQPGKTLSTNNAVLPSAEHEPTQSDAAWIDVEMKPGTEAGQTNQTDQTKESAYIIDLHHRHVISSEWRLSTAEKGYYRQAVTEGSDDQKQWSYLGTSYIFRGATAADELNSYRYGPVKYRYIRIRIFDKDNEPVKFDGVKVKVHPVRIIAKAPGDAKAFPLTAYWGNPGLKSPSYDVKDLMASLDIGEMQTFELAKPKANPNYEPAKPSVPLTERFPFLPPLALVAAVGVAAYILFRNLKQSGADQ